MILFIHLVVPTQGHSESNFLEHSARLVDCVVRIDRGDRRHGRTCRGRNRGRRVDPRDRAVLIAIQVDEPVNQDRRSEETGAPSGIAPAGVCVALLIIGSRYLLAGHWGSPLDYRWGTNSALIMMFLCLV
jgi:hypothetical protein